MTANIMNPEERALWDAIYALQKQVEALQQELQRHYSQPHGGSNYGAGGHGFG